MKTIQCGLIYRRIPGNEEFRVLLVDPICNITVCIRLHSRSARPEKLQLDELNHALSRDALIPVKEAEHTDEINTELLSPAAANRYDKIWRPALGRLLAPGYLALAERCLWPDIQAVAQSTNESAAKDKFRPITTAHLNIVLTKVLQAGGRLTAAIPQWHRGGRNPLVADADHAIAKPTNQPNSFKMSAAEVGKIRASVKKHLVGDATWVDAYDAFLEENYATEIRRTRGKDVVVVKPEGQRPSLQQYYRHGLKALPRSERLKNKHGEHRFMVDFRGKPKGQSAEGVLPGVTAEIDWTISDIVGVRRGNRLSIGRFIIYVVIDKFSGMILAVYLTMHNGRFDEAARAILQCLENKVELCKKFDLEIEPGDWDVEELFHQLVSDKGEIDSFKAAPLVSSLGIHIEHTPARRPDLKGGAESFFAIVRWLLRRLRGGTSGVRQRLEKDPRITAIYDFDDIYHMLLALAVKLNARTRRRQALPAGVDPTTVANVPRDLWRWAKESGCTRQFSLESARLHLLPTLWFRVTSEGIYVPAARIRRLNARGLDNLGVDVPEVASDKSATADRTNPDRLLYSLPTDIPDDIDANEWLTKAREHTYPAEIAIDTTTVDRVLLRHRRQGKPTLLVELQLAPGQEAWAGLSWQEYCILSTQRRRSLGKFEAGEQELLNRWFRKVVDDRTALAAAKSAEARAEVSDADLKANIALNRLLEMAEEHGRSSATPNHETEASFVQDVDAIWNN